MKGLNVQKSNIKTLVPWQHLLELAEDVCILRRDVGGLQDSDPELELASNGQVVWQVLDVHLRTVVHLARLVTDLVVWVALLVF